ncbi:unnamed protein product [Protopolystoma xenopodis]|uniref:PH domain-containing protein n=1 Tax=Protopolystoma xenopodis TaxID=117903 RepID=A0A448XFK7_9PLAT|nr:unnamed protein product [Protopolystoma xenopodis]
MTLYYNAYDEEDRGRLKDVLSMLSRTRNKLERDLSRHIWLNLHLARLMSTGHLARHHLPILHPPYPFHAPHLQLQNQFQPYRSVGPIGIVSSSVSVHPSPLNPNVPVSICDNGSGNSGGIPPSGRATSPVIVASSMSCSAPAFGNAFGFGVVASGHSTLSPLSGVSMSSVPSTSQTPISASSHCITGLTTATGTFAAFHSPGSALPSYSTGLNGIGSSSNLNPMCSSTSGGSSSSFFSSSYNSLAKAEEIERLTGGKERLLHPQERATSLGEFVMEGRLHVRKEGKCVSTERLVYLFTGFMLVCKWQERRCCSVALAPSGARESAVLRVKRRVPLDAIHVLDLGPPVQPQLAASSLNVAGGQDDGLTANGLMAHYPLAGLSSRFCLVFP